MCLASVGTVPGERSTYSLSLTSQWSDPYITMPQTGRVGRGLKGIHCQIRGVLYVVTELKSKIRKAYSTSYVWIAVKLLYKDHPKGQYNVVLIHRWSLYGGSITAWKVYPCGPVNVVFYAGGLYIQVVFRPGLTVYISYVEHIFSRGLNDFCQTRGVYTFPQRTKQ